MSPEVAVIGGGITGCGVARDLAMRGVSVTLFERGGLNAGTTGHTHGVLHSGARYAVVDPPAARTCRRENRILRDIAPHCLTETGGWLLALPGDRSYLERAVEACADAGIETDRVDPAFVRSVDGVTADLVDAVRVPDAVVHPGPLTAATAEDARRAGATIHTHTPVTDLDTAAGTVTHVETEASTVAVDHVVNAAGAGAGAVAAAAGVEVSMAPTRGAMAVLENPGVSRVCNRARPPSDGDVIVPRDGEVVLGTTSVPVDDPDAYPTDESEVETLLAEATAIVPALADRAVRDRYWGVRPLYDAGGRDADRGAVVLDHATRDDLGGLTTVVGGKLTTYRAMAERTADTVCDRLGVDAVSRTATERLPGTAETVGAYVDRFDAAGPADATEHRD